MAVSARAISSSGFSPRRANVTPMLTVVLMTRPSGRVIGSAAVRRNLSATPSASLISFTPCRTINSVMICYRHSANAQPLGFLDGIEEALSAGEEHGVRVIPGIELSAESELGNIHILGYHIDYRNKQLVSILDANKKSRQEKIPKVVAVLQAAGYDITLDEVLKEGKGVIGRPHVASVLVRKGYEPSVLSH